MRVPKTLQGMQKELSSITGNAAWDKQDRLGLAVEISAYKACWDKVEPLVLIVQYILEDCEECAEYTEGFCSEHQHLGEAYDEIELGEE